jgi:hypothetical protein
MQVAAGDRSTESHASGSGSFGPGQRHPQCASTQAEEFLEYSHETGNPLC